MLQCTILSWDADVNLIQALQALLARRFRGPPAEAAADVQPNAPPGAGPISVPQKQPTGQEISGWAMGGSSLSD